MKIRNRKSGVIHAVKQLDSTVTYCGLKTSARSVKYPDSNMVWDWGSNGITCKSCRRAMALLIARPRKERKTMKASTAIERLAQLISTYGNCDIVIGSLKKNHVATIVEDDKSELVSTGRLRSSRVFTFVEEE